MARMFLSLAFFPLFIAALAAAEPVATLVPSQAAIEKPEPPKEQRKKAQSQANPYEVDVLIALLEPWLHAGLDMEMPRLFAALYYPEDFVPGKSQPELINLLSDVEEIRYLNKKAWGANVSLSRPGLYQLILETRPWWDEEGKRYLQQQVKTAIPVHNGARGWDASFGQSFEILPLTRPYGLVAPAFFSGRVLLDGKPLSGLVVRMGRLNETSAKERPRWRKEMDCISAGDGRFSFVLNEPGWWRCEAAIPGDPLKGPDGEMREVDRSTVFWLYVEARETRARK